MRRRRSTPCRAAGRAGVAIASMNRFSIPAAGVCARFDERQSFAVLEAVGFPALRVEADRIGVDLLVLARRVVRQGRGGLVEGEHRVGLHQVGVGRELRGQRVVVELAARDPRAARTSPETRPSRRAPVATRATRWRATRGTSPRARVIAQMRSTSGRTRAMKSRSAHLRLKKRSALLPSSGCCCADLHVHDAGLCQNSYWRS